MSTMKQQTKYHNPFPHVLNIHKTQLNIFCFKLSSKGWLWYFSIFFVIFYVVINAFNKLDQIRKEKKKACDAKKKKL